MTSAANIVQLCPFKGSECILDSNPPDHVASIEAQLLRGQVKTMLRRRKRELFLLWVQEHDL